MSSTGSEQNVGVLVVHSHHCDASQGVVLVHHDLPARDQVVREKQRVDLLEFTDSTQVMLAI